MIKQGYDTGMGDSTKKTCGNCLKYRKCFPNAFAAERVTGLRACVLWIQNDRNREGK
jgi:hypothetical protein